MFKFTLVATILLYIPQDVWGSKFNFTISQVRQCDPLSIRFSSDVGKGNIPMTLTILPLTSTPVFIPIPGVASDTSGVAVTFLPLREGEEFIASLDDANGKSISKVSDLTRVLPSLTGNSSCLEPSGASFIATENFKLTGTPTQCEQVSLTYNTAAVQSAPTVRVFQPKGQSFLLQQTADDPASGSASYLMNVTHGTQVLFMFDDGRQLRQTTGLIAVSGDTSSSDDCLSTAPPPEPTVNATAFSDPDNVPRPASISQAVIIGCSAGGAVILLIALAMLIFVVRDRKRRRRRTIPSFFTQRLQDPSKDRSSRNPFDESAMEEAGDPASGHYITNPPYVMEELVANNDKPSLARDSYSSWTHEEAGTSGGNRPDRSPSLDPLAIQTLDIEGMLNMATPLSGNYIINQAMGSDPAAPHSQEPQAILAPPGAGESRIRHWHAPSDVPADPTGSGTFSGYSVVMPNPFTDENHIVIPSPLIRTSGEPSTPGSVGRPMPVEQMDVEAGASNNEGPPEGDEGRWLSGQEQEPRKET